MRDVIEEHQVGVLKHLGRRFCTNIIWFIALINLVGYIRYIHAWVCASLEIRMSHPIHWLFRPACTVFEYRSAIQSIRV
jgi:hypothetical protein